MPSAQMPSPLAQAILDHTNQRGGRDEFYPTAIDGLILIRTSTESLPLHQHYRPALCISAQGEKNILAGEQMIRFGEGQFLAVSVDLPVLARVSRASPEEPYLALVLELDMALLSEVLAQIPLPSPTGGETLGVVVGKFSDQLADCARRLIELLSQPSAIPVVYPAIARELYYWLLTGPDGPAVARLTVRESHAQRIARAIFAIRENLSRTMSVERLAEVANMSVSSFHHHFKTVTATSPLQYQKQLRLLEARRLMVADAVNVTAAAHGVGYESVSQFTREYTRMFGASPRRDAVQLRSRVTPVLAQLSAGRAA